MTARTFSLFILLLPISCSAVASRTPVDSLDLSNSSSGVCLRCHGMPNFAYRDSLSQLLRNLTVSPELYRSSVHGELQCRDCHPEVKAYPHSFSAGGRKIVACGDDCHARNREGKPYSHAQVYADFRTSVHGKSLADARAPAPRCVTCHGQGNPHAVRRAKQAMTSREKMDLCIACHDDPVRMARNRFGTEPVESYRRSFHFKAIRYGAAGTAVCQDCHTVHHVLPADSAGSSIAPAHIAATCGQAACHPGAKMNFAMSGANHLGLRIAKEPVLWFEEKFFLALTGGTLLMLVAGIFLDIQKKFGWARMARRVAIALREQAATLQPVALRAGRLLKKLMID